MTSTASWRKRYDVRCRSQGLAIQIATMAPAPATNPCRASRQCSTPNATYAAIFTSWIASEFTARVASIASFIRP